MTRTMDGWKHLVAAGLMAAGLGALAAEPVDINEATVEELATAIEGVGKKKAEAIVSFREQNGRFKSIQELTRVRGISPRIVEASRERLKVDK